MSDFIVGMKVYSQDWYWKYNLDYQQAAKELLALGVNSVITLSKYLPMSNSAVNSEIPPDRRARMEQYEDLGFREALKRAGISYYGACNFFFDPGLMHKHGNIPEDQEGEKAVPTDWYIGGCPTDETYVEERISQIETAMEALHMDGIFLGFMRYPGFWELWLPDTEAGNWREYCFCNRCLKKFEAYSGVKIPRGIRPAGKWIRQNARDQWVEFKSQVITDIVKKIRIRVQKINPASKIILNTVPFDPVHYGDSGRQIFAQDPAKLSDVVDIFEVMGYHQILGRPYQWIADTGKYFKSATGKKVVCTIQAKALYLEGMHKGRGRAPRIAPDEFELSLRGVREAGLDGFVVFSWSDFLEQKFAAGDATFTDIITGAAAK